MEDEGTGPAEEEDLNDSDDDGGMLDDLNFHLAFLRSQLTQRSTLVDEVLEEKIRRVNAAHPPHRDASAGAVSSSSSTTPASSFSSGSAAAGAHADVDANPSGSASSNRSAALTTSSSPHYGFDDYGESKRSHMHASERSRVSSYLVRDTATAETEDHEDHSFCGIMFDVEAHNHVPIDFIELQSVAVRGRLGRVRVFVTNSSRTSGGFQYNFRDPDAWQCVVRACPHDHDQNVIQPRRNSPVSSITCTHNFQA